MDKRQSAEYPLLTWQEWNEIYSICYNESYGNRTAAFNAAYAEKIAKWLKTIEPSYSLASGLLYSIAEELLRLAKEPKRQEEQK